MHVRQAVVLVGGKGTRLGALTQATPKPMLEIAPGLRFIDTVLLELARHGFTDIVLLAGHLGEQVEAAYRGVRLLESNVRVVREPQPQGTGGALLFAADGLDPWFVMTNGDSLFEINLRGLTNGLNDSLTARLALREVPDPGRYGAVSVAGEMITAFHEKDPSLKGPALINGGIYLINRGVADRIKGPCSIETDIFPMLARERLLQGRKFEGYFLDIGLPDTYRQAKAELPARRIRPCVFLDRDGVLNVDSGYTHRPDDLKWMPGARKAVRAINEAGYLAVVVTNQAGVAKGHYGEDAIPLFHCRMIEELAEAGAHIDAFYHCPYHVEGTVERYAREHPDRKPNPGMLLRAMADLPIRREGSFLIGDRDSDIGAATAAGVPGYLYEGGDLEALVASKLAAANASRQV